MEYQKASAAAAFTKKLSNGHSFNGNNMYDGVFGGQSKAGSKVEDYAEIFRGGSGSSIPFLDVPELNQRKFSVDVSSSKLDYSNIFGGFGGFDFAVSHEEEFVAKPTRDKKRPAKTPSFSEGSFSYSSSNPVGNQVMSNDQASHGSSNGVKQFKMSYNKSIPGGKDGTNATIHVAVPGFACVVDEKVAPSREKSVSSVVNEPYETNKFGEGKRDSIHCEKPTSDVQPCIAGKKTLKGVDKLHSESKSNGSDCKKTTKGVDQLHDRTKSNGSDYNDLLFGSYDFGHRIPPSKVTRASIMSYNKVVNNHDSLKFGVPRSQSLDIDAGFSSPPYLDDEVDENSVAASSAAALKKAIEEAQARLKVAKEIMERRKGQMGRVKPSFNGSSTGKGGEREKRTVKQNDFREDKAHETSEKIVSSQQTSGGVKLQNVIKADQVAAESEDEESGFVARESAGETHAKNFIFSQANCIQEVREKEAAKEEERKNVVQNMNEREGDEKEIIEKPEVVKEAAEQERKLDTSGEFCDKEECLHRSVPNVELRDLKEDEAKLRFGEQWEKTEEKVCNELEECERKLKELEKPVEEESNVEVGELKDTDNLERLTIAHGRVDAEEKHNCLIESEENGYALKDASEKEDNEMLIQEFSVQKEFTKKSEEAFEISELPAERKVSCGPEENNEEEDAYDSEDNEQMSDKMEKSEMLDDLRDNTSDHEEEKMKLEENGDLLGNDEFMEAEKNGDFLEDTDQMEVADEGRGTEEMLTQTDQEAYEMTEAREDAEDCIWEEVEVADNAYNDNEFNNVGDTLEPSTNVDSCEMTPELSLNEDNGGTAEGCKAFSESEETIRDLEADEVASDLEENLVFDKSDLAESNLKPEEIKQQAENTTDAFNFDRSCMDVDTTDILFEKDQYEQYSETSEKSLTMEKLVDLACEPVDLGECKICLEQEENKYNLEHSDEVRFDDSQSHCNFGEEHLAREIAHEIAADLSTECKKENCPETLVKEERETKNACREEVTLRQVRLVDAQLHCEFGEKHEFTEIAHVIEAGQSSECKQENCPETLMKEESETKNASWEEVKLVKEKQRRVDEAKEREREKEKERIAVERAIREARERAFAEVRERAAAGRTNIEAQRKVKAETQGEAAKPSAEVNDKAFMEAKLKAERAAVERATAEARKRALEKALSEKASLGARNQAEKFSHSKQSFRSYDSRYKVPCPSSSAYSGSSNHSASKYSEGLDVAAGESAQRCKARMERQQRTAERAAKALVEKNERDLLAQKEQAERNRLAETLDAEVKRWSSGKQGNLRALLSTLQYILGPDSGWQPIPLTDIIATAAVKKAYRKATLCVHPDKLQQRGATIQQKYICEKVFDLLKEAWNRFSAEER
ncbi:Ornithine carbamoyltransferase isoform 1 [Hibiscus syriacus]|uniref:Ornithine carbamoyltransferase isoform 1 n=1 Tax=Hibiscus syriacus TaxID=106335 RepID=A0A6A3BA65_HIBSY|nr:auxilin-like protein 1 [Hibiscus syriacus]KAE8712578.1 Ornithine carbamoyltransferase isoform 1 [Hibiscus syriacus]